MQNFVLYTLGALFGGRVKFVGYPINLGQVSNENRSKFKAKCVMRWFNYEMCWFFFFNNLSLFKSNEIIFLNST